jgi:hypothetical protein
MSMRICSYDLVGVDSKTLEPFIFIIFVFVLLKVTKFGTGLKYD